MEQGMDKDGGGGSRWRKGTTEWEKLHDVVFPSDCIYIYYSKSLARDLRVYKYGTMVGHC